MDVLMAADLCSTPVARERRARWRHLLAGVMLVCVGAGGCFSPRKPACAFTCISAGNLCPDASTCGPDGLCHRDGDDDVCGLTAPGGGAGTSGTAGAGGAAGATAAGGAGGAGGAG